MRIKHYLTLGSIALVVLLLPFLLRFYQNKTIAGGLSYFYLSAFPSLFPFSFAYQWLISITLTLLFLLLVLFIVHSCNVSAEKEFIIMLFMIVTPTTLYLSSQPTVYLYALLCIAASLSILSTRFHYLSIIPFAGLLFFDWTALLSGVAYIIAYLIFFDKKKLLPIPLSFLLLFTIIHFIYSRPFAFAQLAERSYLVELFSDLGGVYGFSLFIVLLSIIGLAFTWRWKKEYIPLYGLILVLCLLVLWSRAALLFLYPILSVLAAHAFTYFWKREWVLPFVHILTIAVLCYGILFSMLSYGTTIVFGPPGADMIDGVQWLRSHPFYYDDVVLSHQKNGFFIDYGSKAFVTPLSSVQTVNVSTTIFQSKDFKKTQGLLRENAISLILIDPTMKREVWKTEDDGLLYLFRTSGYFVKVYDADGIEMWRVKE